MPWRYFKIVVLHSRSDAARHLERLLAAAWCAHTDGWCGDGSIYNVKDVGELTERDDTRGERRVQLLDIDGLAYISGCERLTTCQMDESLARKRRSTAVPGSSTIVNVLDLTGLALNGNESSTATSSSSDRA
jgi:hypothetical protein